MSCLEGRVRRFASLLLLLLLAGLAASWLLQATWRDMKGTHGFAMTRLGNSIQLLDFGATDIDGDGYLDLFTSAHNHRQLLLLNQRGAGWSDVFPKLMAQERLAPGLEIADSFPIPDRPGLYVGWEGADILLKAHARGGAATAGTIEIMGPARVSDSMGFEAKVVRDTVNTNLTTVRFSAAGDGSLRVRPAFVALPIRFNFTAPPNSRDLYIGRLHVPAPADTFTLELIDRHGHAWLGSTGGSRSNVFIARGGLRGHMAEFDHRFHDEYLLSSESYRNALIGSGYDKASCPAYQTGWTDVEGDGRLEVYLSCLRGHPNQLRRMAADSAYPDIAAEAGVAIAGNAFETPFLWLDVDLDGDQDLLAEDGAELKLYANEQGKFDIQQTVLRGAARVRKLAVGDYNADGYPDVFAASRDASALLRNNRGTLETIPAEDIGLPAANVTANWIDLDNDGTLELHTVPQGLFTQSPAGSFGRTGRLSFRWRGAVGDARANWIDVDNDGDLDLALAVRYNSSYLDDAVESARSVLALPGGRRFPVWTWAEWDIYVLRNRASSANAWLAIDLQGPAGNPPAVGARVTVDGPTGTQLGIVGQAEGSHFSQGAYRLHFGLGRATAPVDLTVVWPDGTKSQVRTPPNRVLVVEYPKDGA